MRYRLGLDIGAKSIGWAMLRLNSADEPVAVIRLGVRIFPDGRNPKDETSLAASRRLARQMRRRRDRLLMRKRALMRALIDLGFFPADVEERRRLVDLDPYSLRRRALTEALSPGEFARALFHINQRRGFQSNRRTDRRDRDSGTLKVAIKRTRELLAQHGVRTIGAWLADRHDGREGVRARLRGRTVKDRAYDLYVDRSMVADEFDAIWAAQAKFNPDLFTLAARDRLRRILLHQRPLRPVNAGRCTLLPDEERAPEALPVAQEFRIYQEINHLRLLADDLTERPLTLQERDRIADLLRHRKEVPFSTILRKLGLPSTTRLNLQDGKRDKLKGDVIAALLSKDDLFGDAWYGLSADRQGEIVRKLLTTDDEAELVAWLMANFGLDAERAEKIANCPLPDGHSRLSVLALDRIVPELKRDVVSYAEAVQRAGFDSHSALSHAERTGEVMPLLPYYGEALQRHVGFGSGVPTDPPERRFGRIANPTVHIGLNELRKVVNGLIARYGHPSEIVVELARELKQSKAARDEIAADQARRQAENVRYRDEIRSLLRGGDPSSLDIQKRRLWHELNPTDAANRRCPYTGEQIGIERLFSDEVEVEHILPFSKTLDDSLNNKTVAVRRANRDKGNRSPYEAFGHSPAGYDYAAILERAKLMPPAKARRFAPDGYDHWLKNEKDFLARALNDTAYLSRVAKEYLTLVCHKDRVRVIPGRLTALLRGKYGLNHLLSGSSEKNRDDHRHHAIDAAVIAITDQGLLQRFAQASARATEKGVPRLVEEMPEPWGSFRQQVARAVGSIVVSFRPDHGYQGALHNDTAYGLLPGGKVVTRKPLAAFKSSAELADKEFRNAAFKEWLLGVLGNLEGKAFMERVEQIAKEFSVHRVRVVEKLDVIRIAGRSGTERRHGLDEGGSVAPYKGYKGDSNYCLEIGCDGRGRWKGTVVSTFDAHRIARVDGPGRLRDPRVTQEGLPLVMRLMIDDLVETSDRGSRRIMRVVTVKGRGEILLAPANEANVDKRNRDAKSGFKYVSKTAGSLQAAAARSLTVSPIGDLRYRSHKG
jgi:CRISPR-associated endonuclease Csn1